MIFRFRIKFPAGTLQVEFNIFNHDGWAKNWTLEWAKSCSLFYYFCYVRVFIL